MRKLTILTHLSEIERDLNSILDKINREGLKSLTQEEEERLYKNSKNLSKGKKKD